MDTEEQLSKEMEAAIAKALRPRGGILGRLTASEEVNTAKTDLIEEEVFYQSQLHSEQIADMKSARVQREEYAEKFLSWLELG